METRRTEMTFTEGFLGVKAKQARENKAIHKAFDWDKAGKIIKERLEEYPDLVAEAGLQCDWECTAGVIFEDGKPCNDSYTYLKSNWAVPTLILNCDDQDEEIECWIEANERFNENSKWDETSLDILGIKM